MAKAKRDPVYKNKRLVTYWVTAEEEARMMALARAEDRSGAWMLAQLVREALDARDAAQARGDG